MKLASLLSALLALFVGTCSLANAQVIHDSFGGSTINPDLWTIKTPFYNSRVIPGNGCVITAGRGILATNMDISGPYEVSGKFAMLDDAEIFCVCLRSNLETTSDCAECYGIHISFQNDGKEIQIEQWTPDNGMLMLNRAPFPLRKNKEFSFSIKDTNDSLSVYVDDSLVLTISTSYRAGKRIAFYGRNYNSLQMAHSTCLTTVNIDSAP